MLAHKLGPEVMFIISDPNCNNNNKDNNNNSNRHHYSRVQTSVSQTVAREPQGGHWILDLVEFINS